MTPTTSQQFDPRNFSANMDIISINRYAGRNPEDMTLGFVITGQALSEPAQTMFVGSRPHQYASAMLLDWWSHCIFRSITQMHEELIKRAYAELWDDAPGTGKHPIIDLIRRYLTLGGSITIQPVNGFIDELWKQRASISPDTKNPLFQEVLEWGLTQLDAGNFRDAGKQQLVATASDLPGARENHTDRWAAHQWLTKAIFLYHRTHENEIVREIAYGRAPEGSVVMASDLPPVNGKYSLSCTIIIRRVDAEMRAKTNSHELLHA
ncbi:MAG: hypothetical protein WAV46_00685 [Candidatus Moraniibacteriota bacterium]